MATNDFIGFASNGSANIMSQADYAAAVEQGDGVQPGMASSALANKVWRQGANMAAALGRIAAARGYDALDNGDLDALQTSVADAISVGTFNRMFFSQTSGSYTAPRTGVYRITLKGGGGGGGGALTSSGRGGAGGGEGATNIFYATFTKSTAYAYVIGAGGTGGVSSAVLADVTSGANGGDTSIIIDGTTYIAKGGYRGNNSQTVAGVGFGGDTSATTGISIPGANGMPGPRSDTTVYPAASGGGQRGGVTGSTLYNGEMGGGGGGANSATGATAGGDGYILIEYAG